MNDNIVPIIIFPSGLLISILLFEIIIDGPTKFGWAIFSLIIILPISAIISFAVLLRKQYARIIYCSIGIAFLTVIIVSLGSTLGYYGMLLTWSTSWALGYGMVNKLWLQ
ncbi:MAG: hypothetical protein ABGX31_00910 [bacterium]